MPKGYKKDGSPIGGARAGSGNFSPYGEITKQVGFRCPLSKVEEFKLHCEAKLKTYAKPKEK